MIISIDPSKDEPIYMQLKNQIILGIASGKLSINDSLPTVRQLAADTQINMMTVNKAYQLLKQEGYIFIDRRRGAVIKVSSDTIDQARKQGIEELKLLVAKAAVHGIKKEEFISLCSSIYDEVDIKINVDEE